MLTVPTAEKALRIKGFLIVRRNQTRDYLDVAALADRYGLHEAAGILARIDYSYTDQHGGGRGVAAQLIQRGDLADWHRITTEVRADPWGKTAPQVEEVLSHSRPYSVAEAMETVHRRLDPS